MLVGIAALAVTAAACGGGTPRTSASAPGLARCEAGGITKVGDPIPLRCTFDRLDGGTLALSSLVGKPAVINFWASWCSFCIREMPDFQRVHEELAERVTFVGADLLNVEGETRGDAMRFARSTGVKYTLIWDDGGLLYEHFAARLVAPTTIFVDRAGRVAHRQLGPLTAGQLRRLIAEHLGVA
jgi:cytochrome c biogenesis protein CcmG, thiol:disulfide interchange protein DsbE